MQQNLHLLYVIEPHPLAARQLFTILRTDPRFTVVLSGFDLSDTSSQHPSGIIIDADALPFPTASFLATVHQKFNGTRVLVIGSQLSDEQLALLLVHGARGFVRYADIDKQICAAVVALVQGHIWFPTQVLERYVNLPANMRRKQRPNGGVFSVRESEIIGLLQRRMSDKEIGCALGISERTVRFHLQNIFSKVGVRDRHRVIDLMQTQKLDGVE